MRSNTLKGRAGLGAGSCCQLRFVMWVICGATGTAARLTCTAVCSAQLLRDLAPAPLVPLPAPTGTAVCRAQLWQLLCDLAPAPLALLSAPTCTAVCPKLYCCLQGSAVATAERPGTCRAVAPATGWQWRRRRRQQQRRGRQAGGAHLRSWVLLGSGFLLGSGLRPGAGLLGVWAVGV